jgi:hypothetical protein
LLVQQWIKVFLTSVILIMTITGTINYIVNPYNVFDTRFNALFPVKTQELSDRMSKFYIVNRVKPKTIMVGTSRIGYFQEKQLAPYVEGPVYNLSLAGSSIEEQAAYVRYMVKHHHLKNIIWSLDFFSFNPTKPINSSFEYKRLNNLIFWNDYTVALFTHKTLKRSFETIETNIFPDVLSSDTSEQPLSSEKLEFNINSMLHRYATEAEFLKSEDFKNPFSINKNIETLRNTLQYCRENNVSCTLYTSPVFYEHIYMIYGIGLGKTFEHWKKELALLQPYTDFCTINSITKKPIYFRDSSHATSDVGRLVFSRIFLQTKVNTENEFGTLISPKNIDTHLARQQIIFSDTFSQLSTREIKDKNVTKF